MKVYLRILGIQNEEKSEKNEIDGGVASQKDEEEVAEEAQ